MPIAIILPGETAPSFEAGLATIDMTTVECRLFEVVRVNRIAMPCKILAELKGSCR
jgi:hypothetical protein